MTSTEPIFHRTPQGSWNLFPSGNRIIVVFGLIIFILHFNVGCEGPTSDNNISGCLEDTTSHSFSWEIDSIITNHGIPIPGLSVLNDMTFISENDIWLMGKFYADTSNLHNGSEWETFNAIHWNGDAWQLRHFLVKKVDGYYGFSKLMTGYASGPDDIWMLSYTGSYLHWNGTSWETEFIEGIGGTPIDMWGASSSNFYICGYNGSITQFIAPSFLPMNSGVAIPLRHIYGYSENHIWAIGYENNSNGIQNKLIEYEGGDWIEVHHQDDWQENWPPQDYNKPSGIYLSTWAYDDTLYLGCASLWKESITTGKGYLMRLENLDWELMYGVGAIEGNHCNDIFAFSALGLRMTHYNGIRWKQDAHLAQLDPQRNIDIAAAQVTDDMVVLACTDFASGNIILLKGYRQ